ncbi:hypothetical protein [Photobacterium sp. OFAV2-7]|nr:hypothetical protein [Photobacterium sp. OFAV2-7]MCG7586361.1 hypothetical protein [Photobacterium sp. OFAV2-7]
MPNIAIQSIELIMASVQNNTQESFKPQDMDAAFYAIQAVLEKAKSEAME